MTGFLQCCVGTSHVNVIGSFRSSPEHSGISRINNLKVMFKDIGPNNALPPIPSTKSYEEEGIVMVSTYFSHFQPYKRLILSKLINVT